MTDDPLADDLGQTAPDGAESAIVQTPLPLVPDAMALRRRLGPPEAREALVILHGDVPLDDVRTAVTSVLTIAGTAMDEGWYVTELAILTPVRSLDELDAIPLVMPGLASARAANRREFEQHPTALGAWYMLLAAYPGSKVFPPAAPHEPGGYL